MIKTTLPNGSYVAVLTPMTDSLEPDLPLLLAHSQSMLNQGAQGIALLGTTGEANSFTLQERMKIMSGMIDGGIPGSKIMVGTGCCAYGETVLLTKYALDLGIASILMLPPFYYKQVDDQGLFSYFRKVVHETADDRLEVYLYHFPKMTGLDLSIDLLGMLFDEFPGIFVGMKDSGGDVKHMKMIIDHFPDFRVFAGTEKYLLDILRMGGAGCISATGNVTVRACTQLYENWQMEDADKRQEKLTTMRSCFEGLPFTAILKQYLAKLEQRPSWLNIRPPNALLSEEIVTNVFAQLNQIKIKYD
jgi:4-hydroxy-tetrahydrodipicolinate synthase